MKPGSFEISQPIRPTFDFLHDISHVFHFFTSQNEKEGFFGLLCLRDCFEQSAFLGLPTPSSNLMASMNPMCPFDRLCTDGVPVQACLYEFI